jgi:hypothetical protein
MKTIFFLLVILATNFSFANVLGPDAPERKQLIAMGYDIEKEVKSDTYTIANLGSVRMIIEKNEERLSISRVFNIQRKLSKDDEFELLKILNKFNTEFTYQFTLGVQSITCSLYYYGSYDARTFARMIRLIDRVNSVFDTEPKFYKLVNN